MSAAKMHGMHHALARLYTLAEVDAVACAMPWNELDARFRMGLAYACAWAGMPNLRCAMCNEPLVGHATYLVVLMPADPEVGLGSSGAVCSRCGQNLPREQLQALAEQAAQVMFEPVGGHA